MYITIGNSDDKLSQSQWADYQCKLLEIVDEFQKQIHGIWYSAPRSPYQNMCVCVEVDDTDGLVKALRGLCRDFNQDSIALYHGSVTLVGDADDNLPGENS